LQLQPSKSQPVWVANYSINVPKTFFRDTFELRGPDFNELISYPNLGTDSVNRQSYAFGLIINIDGAGAPAALTPMYDVFAEVDITLSQLTQTQTLDLQNETTLSQKKTYRSGSTFSKDVDTKALESRLAKLELKLSETVPDLEDIRPQFDRKELEKKIGGTLSDIVKRRHLDLAYEDEIEDIPSTGRKSTSRKSQGSTGSRDLV